MDPRDRHNLCFNAAGEALWGFQWSMVLSSTALVVLLSRYGAGPELIGSISSVELGMMLLPQAIGSYLFHSRRRRKTQLILWHWGLVIPPLAAIGVLAWLGPQLAPGLVRWGVLGLFAWYCAAMGVITAVWWEWVAHLFHERIRGTVLGVSFCAAAVTGSLGALVGGRVLQALPENQAFGILYVLAGLMAGAAMVAFSLIDDPAAGQADTVERLSLPDLVRRFRASLADANYRVFLVGRMLGIAGFCILPQITAYYRTVPGGSLSDSTVVSCGAAMAVGAAAANLLVGLLGNRHGYRSGAILNAALQVVTLGLLFLPGGAWMSVVVYGCAGMCIGSGFMAYTNLMLESCPHDSRMAHFTIGNLVLCPAVIGAPLLAGFAVAHLGVRWVFAASLFFSVLTLAWFAVHLREPRRKTGVNMEAAEAKR